MAPRECKTPPLQLSCPRNVRNKCSFRFFRVAKAVILTRIFTPPEDSAPLCSGGELPFHIHGVLLGMEKM